MAIRKAEKQQGKLRLALIGVSGSGKTYTGLAIATALGGKVGVIDTERNSACLYSDQFEFDVEADIQTFGPKVYVEKIRDFSRLEYPVLMIDSLSHAWVGPGGALQLVDEAGKRNAGNKFAGWGVVTPQHNEMIDAILSYPGHVIVTMRSKMEYVQEKDERGKTTIRKVGLQPIQRDGLEYEFTVVGDMNAEHELVITKSRCHVLADKIIQKPGKDVAETLLRWLNDGAPAAKAPTFHGDDGIGEREAFRIQLDEAFDARGFSPEDVQLVTRKVLTKKHVGSLEELGDTDRREFVRALAAGELDKFKLSERNTAGASA